jgi:hypothetical protein
MIFIQKRRSDTLLSSLSKLKYENDKNQTGMHGNHLSNIKEILNYSNIKKSILNCEFLYKFQNIDNDKMLQNNDKNINKNITNVNIINTDQIIDEKLKLRLNAVPKSLIRDLCRSTGVSDYFPNVPFINRLNEREISRYVDMLRDSDEFLYDIGIHGLSETELKHACHERCIGVVDRNTGQLKGDLEEWLYIALDPPPIRTGLPPLLPVMNVPSIDKTGQNGLVKPPSPLKTTYRPINKILPPKGGKRTSKDTLFWVLTGRVPSVPSPISTPVSQSESIGPSMNGPKESRELFADRKESIAHSVTTQTGSVGFPKTPSKLSSVQSRKGFSKVDDFTVNDQNRRFENG